MTLSNLSHIVRKEEKNYLYNNHNIDQKIIITTTVINFRRLMTNRVINGLSKVL
jgi:hypothetical protein